MKTLTLNYATWRSGKDGENAVGIGRTLLLNQEGYMCCLGQWCLQAGLSVNDIQDIGLPESMEATARTTLLKHEDFGKLLGQRGNTFLERAITINDTRTTTAREKMKQLKQLCKGNNITLKIINKPSWFKQLFK